MSAYTEGLDIVRASERLAALKIPILGALTVVDDVAAVAPDLEPELEEIRRRLVETTDHVLAAMTVLSAKLELLRERA